MHSFIAARRQSIGFLFKLTALLLIFIFAFPAQLFAQQVVPDISSADSISVEPTNPPTTPVVPTTAGEPAADADLLPEPATPRGGPTRADVSGDVVVEDGYTPNTIEDPAKIIRLKADEETKRFYKVDELNGAFGYEVPLSMPPGRSGVEPKVSLVYSSSNTDLDSPFGKGWTVTIPHVQLVNRYGSDKFYASTTFYSSISGELATTSTPGLFYAESDGGENLMYEFSNNAWKVTDKNGWVYFYGTTTSARQDDPNNTNRIYKWMLEEVRDPNGNYITYQYYKSNGQIYPRKILYTGHDSDPGIFEVEFVRQNRNDTPTLFYPSFAVKTLYKIGRIEVKINGSWVRKYDLTYTTADNGNVLALNEIIESGKDEIGQITTLSPIEFDYQIPIDTFSQSEIMESPVLFAREGINLFVTPADVNGDGLVDLIKSTQGEYFSPTTTVFMNRGSSGWVPDYSWNIPVIFGHNGTDLGVRVVDLNGDGFADIVKSYDNSPEGSWNFRGVYLNNRVNGWTYEPSWAVPELFVSFSSFNLGIELVDVNGDGLPDLVKSFDGSTNSGFNGEKVYINTGHSWVLDSSWNLPVLLVRMGTDLGARIADVNGDGLADVLKSYDDQYLGGNAIYINNGHGWDLSSSTVPIYFKHQGQDLSVRLADMNGDGLVDLVKSYYGGSIGFTDNAIYLNTGENSWVRDESWAVPELFAREGIDFSVQIFDANGDNLADIVKAYEAYSFMSEYSSTNTHINNGKNADLLSHIIEPRGGEITAQYQSSAQYEESGNLLNPELPYPIQTIKAFGYSDGLGLVATTTFEYRGGDLYYEGPYNKKTAGYNSITTENPAGNKTKVYYHQGNQSDNTHGEYSDDKYKIGKPYRIEITDSNGDLYQKNINTWETVTNVGNGKFVLPTKTIEFSYDGDSDHKEKAVGLTFDAIGNFVQKTDFGEVSGSDDGAFTDTGSDKLITAVTYATSTSSTTPRLSKQSKETVVNQAGSKVREQKTYYDDQSFGLLTKGNPTKEEFWRAGSSYIDTEKTYNSYGLVTQEKDPRDKVTTYTHDTYNLYIATTTNPLSQKTFTQYDYSSGKPKRVTDANGSVFETVFDGLDRPITEKQPDLTSPSTLVIKTEYSYVDSGVLPRLVYKRNYLNAATSSDMYVYLDGLGRTVQERIEAENANTFTVKDTHYNSVGKVLKESLPYFSTGASSTAPTNTDELYINYEYDPLQRVTLVENVVGETENEYDDWMLTVTDPDGKVKKLYKDAYDNLVRVDEENGISTYTTEYEYDGNKNLTKITDALGNVRNFTYDGLGRRLTAEDLHAVGDTYFGTWTYVYDDAGNLSSVTDPKSQVIEYTYDDLNRPLIENHTAGAGYEAQYGYDACANGVGRLCSATTTAVTTRNQYNVLGGISSEKKIFGVASYDSSYTYDRQGNQVSIVNPDHSTTTNLYNSAGQLEKVLWQGSSDISPQLIVEDFDYAPTGKVAYMKQGNGVETTNTYNAEELYRLTNRQTTGPEIVTEPYIQRFYSSSGDGWVSNWSASSNNWSVARNASVGLFSGHTSPYPVISVFEEESVPTLYRLSRHFYPFDTSSIPSNAIVTDATLGLYFTSDNYVNTDNDGDDFLSIVQTSQSSNSQLSTADYGSIGETEGSNRIDWGGLTQNSYNMFSLNSNGLAWIKKSNENSNCGTATGWTCLGIREGHDLIDSVIAENTKNQITIRMSEFSGTTSDPYLDVTYEIPINGEFLQDVDYIYSDAGDILSIEEKASTTAYRKVDYQYDDLHRLSRASSTKAANNYLETYSYNAIGNLTNKSDFGTYLYAGTTTSNYTNPHAATLIGGTNLTYDNNGNLLTYGNQSNTWNFKNQITQTVMAGSTSTMSYDHTGERSVLTENGNTTRYISQSYTLDITNTIPTRYIYANGELVATIEDEANAESLLMDVEFSTICDPFCEGEIPKVPVIHYVHNDHLSGSNIVTDVNGALEETLDYYPYGKIRVDESATDFKEKHKFASTIFDENSGLNYMNARYHDGSRGQFLSQDPAFLAVGSPGLKQKTNMELAQYLSDPQVLNSYSYARNNPLKYVDQSGEFIQFAPAIIAVAALVASSGHMIPGLIDNYRTTLSVAPGVGDAIAAKEAYTGRSFLNGNELGTGERLLSGLSAIPILGTLGDVGKTALRDEKLIKQIGDYAAQHSFQKHVIDQKEFGSMMKNESQLSEYAQGVMRNPSDVRQLSNGRTAFWDNRLGGVVIHNSQDPKQSTVFRPTTEFGRYNGKKFFNRLR